MVKQKGPPLTREERIAKKRMKKLLKKQKREEKARQVKRDHLERELKYCQLNREKYEKNWRKTLLDLKAKDLHIDYQYQINNSERVLDAKDMEISILMDELNIAERQYEFNLQKYILNFDKIVDALDQSLNDLKNEYDEDLTELLVQSNAEREQRIQSANDRELNLKLCIFGLDRKRQIQTNEDKSRYLSRIKEEEDMTMAEIELKQAALESRFEQLWRAYKETINEYKRENDETRKKYDVLFNQDTFMRKWIKEQTRQLFKAYDKIHQLKFEQSQEKDTIDLKLKAKMEEQQFFLDSFHYLKRKLKEDLDRDEEQMRNVVKYCNQSIHKLSWLRNKGEHILTINAICRKYETSEELVMPYPEFSPKEVPLTARLPSLDPVKLYREKRVLDMFLQRCSQGDALRNFLLEEYEYYTNENTRLKNMLFGHCKTSNYSCKNIAKKERDKKAKKRVHFLCVKNFEVAEN